MSTSDDDRRDRALWRRYRQGREASPVRAADADLLAAWIEGRATPQEAEAAERALAEDPDLLAVVLALREGPVVPEPVPRAVIERAEALVPGVPSRRRARLFALLRAAGRQAVAAAVAVLLMGPVGFHLGRVAGRSRAAPVPSLPPEVRMLFEDLAADPGLAAMLAVPGARGGSRR